MRNFSWKLSKMPFFLISQFFNANSFPGHKAKQFCKFHIFPISITPLVIQEKCKICIKLTGSAHENYLHQVLIFSLFGLFFLSEPKKPSNFHQQCHLKKKSSVMDRLSSNGIVLSKKILRNIFFNQKVRNFTIFKNCGTGTTSICVPGKCTSYMLKKTFF